MDFDKHRRKEAEPTNDSIREARRLLNLGERTEPIISPKLLHYTYPPYAPLKVTHT